MMCMDAYATPTNDTDYIMPLVINSLGDTHTHTHKHMHTDICGQSNSKKPTFGIWGPYHTISCYYSY